MNDIRVTPSSPRPTPLPPSPEPAHSPSTPPGTGKQPAGLKAWLKCHWPWLTIVIVLLIGGGSTYAWLATRPTPTPKATVVNKATPKPTPTPTPLQKASPLTGVMINPALADRPVISVVVENSPEARPQSGLSQAGVVYEALAEGGITRFQTFWLDGQSTSIGPVRSLRPYFIDWGLEFGAPVAHAGGSATALSLVGPTGLTSLNALIIGAPTFYRTTDRQAPHNLYTSSGLLDKLLANRGLAKSASFTPSPRQTDHAATTASAPNISINYSTPGFLASYKYDAVKNDYARSIAGTSHIDRVTGQQIHVKNVVVEYMPTATLADGHMQMDTVGQGDGIVFRDGIAIKCRWIKDARGHRTKLLDTTGTDIPLNAGNTWYSIVPVGRPVTY